MKLIYYKNEWRALGDGKVDTTGRVEKLEYVTALSLFDYSNKDYTRADETSVIGRVLKSKWGQEYVEYFSDGCLNSILAPILGPVNVRYTSFIPRNIEEIKWCRTRGMARIPAEAKMMLRGEMALCPNL